MLLKVASQINKPVNYVQTLNLNIRLAKVTIFLKWKSFPPSNAYWTQSEKSSTNVWSILFSATRQHTAQRHSGLAIIPHHHQQLFLECRQDLEVLQHLWITAVLNSMNLHETEVVLLLRWVLVIVITGEVFHMQNIILAAVAEYMFTKKLTKIRLFYFNSLQCKRFSYFFFFYERIFDFSKDSLCASLSELTTQPKQ